MLPSSELMILYWLQFLLVSGLTIKYFQQKSHKNVPLYSNWTSIRLRHVKTSWTLTLDFFPWRFRHWKVRKVTDPGFWIKVQWGSESSKKPQNEVFSVLENFFPLGYISFFALTQKCQWSLTFRKNSMFWKDLVLELWSKNLKANLNARFFKLEYLTNKLRYEVEFLDVTRGP